MIELFMSDLKDGFVVVVVAENNVLHLHLFDGVIEEHVIEEHVFDILLLGFVFLAKLLLGLLANDRLLLRRLFGARLPRLLQAGCIEEYAVRNVEHVPEPVVGETEEVRQLMERIEVVQPVGEVVQADLLRNLLRLTQLLDPDVEELIALVREEDIVEEWLCVITAKLQEERLLVLVVDVVHQVGNHLRIGDNDRDERHIALRGFRAGDLDAMFVVLF